MKYFEMNYYDIQYCLAQTKIFDVTLTGRIQLDLIERILYGSISFGDNYSYIIVLLCLHIIYSTIRLILNIVAIKVFIPIPWNKLKESLNNTNPNIPVRNIETINSYFDGGLLQLISWKLLGGFVTLLTLGICYPWSFTMLYRWETKHTVLDGKRLCFDGTAPQLFGNWIKWWLLTLITIGIYGFWVPIKLKKWKTKHTYFIELGTPVLQQPESENN